MASSAPLCRTVLRPPFLSAPSSCCFSSPASPRALVCSTRTRLRAWTTPLLVALSSSSLFLFFLFSLLSLSPSRLSSLRLLPSFLLPFPFPTADPGAPAARTTTRHMTASMALRSLSIHNINPRVRAAKYAVRGELATKAETYREQLKQGDAAAAPFDNVISANIGNPQQLDQPPITFFRQVLSLLEYPALLAKPAVLRDGLGYERDAIERAQWLLDEVRSVGAYSQSQGVPAVRRSVARFIERRDGHPARADDIFLCAGASSGVNTLLTTICSSPQTGVLVPIPQYPLYTATLALLGARVVPYYLDEASGWSTDLQGIQHALQQARAEGTDVRAIVVINPGNPTGGVLQPHEIQDVLKLAAREKLVVIGDEVYQTNIFQGKFTSFKKGLRDLQRQHPGAYDTLELVSMHSISKGMVGECGHRGGYFELIGFDPEVVAQINKFVSISLCAPVVGQCLLEMMVNPPRDGDPSYPLYQKEYNAVFDGLRQRATALHQAFKQMEGVESQDPQGSMYIFPTINLPAKAIEKARADGRAPDEYYCMRLLDATGICVVPGSGFGQKENTLHFRTTFLAPGTEWVQRITKFHEGFMDEFRD